MKIESIAVYCGSNFGFDAAYAESARALGKRIAAENWTLVYGGGNVGLMGVVADSVLEAGGKVIGVMPKLLIEKEVAHMGLTELHPVSSMHERKQRMIDLSDAFVALPGGVGTLEEIAEAYTWFQLGIHQKPCGLINVSGYYDALIGFLGHMVKEGFMRSEHLDSLLVSDDLDELVGRLKAFEPFTLDKWLVKKPSDKNQDKVS